MSLYIVSSGHTLLIQNDDRTPELISNVYDDDVCAELAF